MAGKTKAKSGSFNFSHLFGGRASADAGYQEQDRSQRLDKEDKDDPGEVKTAITEKMRRIMNMTNPNTPDNVAARRKADEQYQEQIAQATAARNNALRSTGLALPGDARRVDGTPVGPDDEAESVKQSLALHASSSVR